MYVKISIQCNVISDLYNEDEEVLWAVLRPARLPNGYTNIVIGVVSHLRPPLEVNYVAKKEYFISSLEKVESAYPNSAIRLTRDFNMTLKPMF